MSLSQKQSVNSTSKKEIQGVVKSAEYRELQGLYDSPGIFDIVNDSINENAYSRFLSYLFNSHNPHSFGCQALQLWLRSAQICSRCRIPSVYFRNDLTTTTTVEWVTELGRRVDIVIELLDCENKRIGVVAIENKIWSGEQEEQLADYQDALNRAFPSCPMFLFFLTPDGRKHRTAKSNHACSVFHVPYQSIVEMCSALSSRCRDPQLQLLLDSFRDHLHRKFSGRTKMDDSAKKYVLKLYQDPAHRRAMRFIASNLPSALSFVKDVLVPSLNKKIRKNVTLSYCYPGNVPNEFNFLIGEINRFSPKKLFQNPRKVCLSFLTQIRMAARSWKA